MRVRPPIFRSSLRAVPVTIRRYITPFLAAEIGLRIISAPKNQASFALGWNLDGEAQGNQWLNRLAAGSLRIMQKCGASRRNSCSSAFCIACLPLYVIAPVRHTELDPAVCDHFGVNTLVYANGTRREHSR